MCTVAGIAFALSGATARAQPTLAILGLTSEEGDDARAAELTDALRAEVENDAGVELSTSRASLSQMLMLQDCEVTDPACRVRIARALDAEQVIYGSIHRQGTRGHALELRLVQARDGGEVSARRVVPTSDTDQETLAPHMRALLAALRGEHEAEADAQQNPGPPPVPTITPDVAPLAESDFAPDAGEPPRDEVEPSSNDWIGYSLLGVAAISAGLTVFSWTQIQSANDDVEDYRTAVWRARPREQDVCALADDDMRFGYDAQMIAGVRDACGRGQTFETLQYVFIAAALASAGAGAWLLLDDDGGSAAAPATVRAAVGKDSGLVSVRVGF